MKVIRYISLGSICCAGLAIVLGLLYCILMLGNIYSDILFDTIIYLFRAGLVLGIIAIFAILITRTYWWGLIPAIISILVCGAIVWVDISITMHSRKRYEILKGEIGDYNLRLLGEALVQYAKTDSGHLPSAENWCDSLLEKSTELTRENFKHPKAAYLGFKGECQFAFNKNLSGAKISEIPDDVVLVFEADGDWNLNGTGELLKTRYREHGHIAVLFLGGTMRNYWFDRQAIKTFDKHGEHMYYIKPRWKP